MNEEQKKSVQRALERAHRAIEELELETHRDVSKEIAAYRDDIWMLQNEQFMDGLFEAAEAVRRGERGVRLKDIKRKSKRA
jgi:hypothetical protein